MAKAKSEEQIELLEMILKSDVDLNAKTYYLNLTALHKAV